MTEKDFRFPQLMWSRHDNAILRPIDYTLGKITREGNFHGDEVKRPLSLRSERAEIYKKIMTEKDPDKRKNLIEEAHDFDNIFSEFLGNRKQVEVNLGELGIQSAEYTEIKYKKTDLNKPPIVVIPGISNDLDGIGEFPIKLAMLSKRRVFVFTYPESWHGKVTKEFAEEIGRSNNFKPHTYFFRSVINKIVGIGQEIDIMGVSAGSIITAELMVDNNFKRKVNRASLIVPPGLVNMDFKNTVRGGKRELKSLLFFDKKPARVSVLHPEKIRKTIEERESSQLAFKNIFKKLSQEYPWWKNNLASKTGEKTEVIIADTDGVTNGVDGLQKIKQNSSLNLHVVKKSSHSTLGSIPEKILGELKF